MYLPPAFPDELLLGRLIRHATVSGETVWEMSQRLFGSQRTSIHPFLTAGLASLAESLQEDVDTLLYDQTLAPLFLFYLPNHAERLRSHLLASHGSQALRESQLSTFGCGHSVCLKWCPLCAVDDIHELGVTYWHRIHQLPGVTACFRHPVLLEQVELTSRQRIVPSLLPICNSAWQSANPIEMRVAAFSHGLLNLLGKNTALTIELASRYRERLNDLGYITNGGHVRRKSLLHCFSGDVEEYRSSPASPLLRGHDDYRYLSELLDIGGSHHPFRHLLFGTWLFSNPEDFFGYTPPTITPVPMEKDTEEPQLAELRCLKLLKEGRSLAEVSRLTGKSRCYLKRVALMHRVKLNLKPKCLNNVLQQKIIMLARKGVHRRRISQLCGIGVGSVEQVISAEPGLVEWRKQCHLESKRRACRVQILRYRQLHPDALRRDIKSECNAAFFWLYLRDRAWLEKSLPRPTKPCGPLR
ncbi:TnsD family transposase [Shewanella sp. 3B26]|uniref:TnsD family transposase n=1 Tax=Shewanella zhuhaiensis TaxID=2919576 RepID=A0AAJ1BK12_9GAMM|nr:TnsD family Tn7-like transposition protein [Shewanella zhuhaiensis]MCH4296131.1 TnsD family transposase [Shewanella zhuhaiensis]